MNNDSPRCPSCASPLHIETTFRERLGFAPQPVRCVYCLHVFDPRQARSMGASYTHWCTHFTAQLGPLVKMLPLLDEPSIHRLLHFPPPETLRTFDNFDALATSCLLHNSALLLEMAKGRQATLDAAHLHATDHTPLLVAVLGTSSAESGARERELLIARTGHSQYVLYTHPAKVAGAELHVKRAIHAAHSSVH